MVMNSLIINGLRVFENHQHSYCGYGQKFDNLLQINQISSTHTHIQKNYRRNNYLVINSKSSALKFAIMS